MAPRARHDLQRTLLRSRRQWGQEQSRRYQRAFERAFETLRANPELGRRRENVFPGCRAFASGQHMIYYRVDVTAIVIARVLHSRQDVTSAVFDPPAPDSQQDEP